MKPVRINIQNLEKILAVFNLLWALLLFFSTFQFMYGLAGLSSGVSNGIFEQSQWDLFVKFHWVILLGLISLVSACLLFFNRRIGWMGSVIASFSNSVLLILITALLYKLSQGNLSSYLLPIGLLIFHLTGFIFLLLKKVRASHNIQPKYLWITIGILAVFMTDLLLNGF
jgi:hypothetical protein